MIIYKVECAWCSRLIGGDPRANVVSHGICLDCMAEVLEDNGRWDPSVWEAWLDYGGEG